MNELNFFWSFPEYIHTHEAISLSTLMLPLRAMCLKKSLPFSICVVCVYVLDNMHNLTRSYYQDLHTKSLLKIKICPTCVQRLGLARNLVTEK